ncbi:FtsB family cell division protein [Algoriphagus sanaruensis]|uniref:Septum formation initiator n=1 Tax=Algoriphagus sanaruensis TaxID=1727163 RepID=A0A142EL87_9BACT|nr:septum formation initiator family protein [Algoriphagus sanaruensis]AMQ55892.1 septum formation initiator [Algoriphagus sanaruensis]
MRKLIKYGSNFYIISSLLFLFWMIFIDSNSIPTHIKLSQKLYDLEDQKEFYLEKKQQIKAEREELMSNPELLEKFARERYFMKKQSEDLYVIVEK